MANRNRALKICKMLLTTINKISTTIVYSYNSTFEIPRANKKTLKRIRKKLIEKYNIKEEEL